MKPTTPVRSLETGFLTIEEVAKRWQISRRQVHRYIRSGDLKAHYFGRSVRIAIEDVLLFEMRCRRVA